MKKKTSIIIIVPIALALIIGYTFFGPMVQAPKDNYLYIPTGSDYMTVVNRINQEAICNVNIFRLYAVLMRYPSGVRSGKYKIDNNSSIFTLLRKLKSGRQEEVRLTINKLRTKEDLARLISQKLEPDYEKTLHFLTCNDSLKEWGVDTNTVMSLIIPNTYLFWWNGSIHNIMGRMKKQHDYFWERRKEKLQALSLNEIQVYTIASIIEEETNKNTDKEKIASVYMNRLNKGMKLEADPTVKYALRDFSLKRVYHKHLAFPSAYNTYHVKGLPPGPICTPSIPTIEAVLNAPKTEYLFFVAKPDFSGYSNFSSTYDQHLKYAHAYQLALDELMKKESH